MFIITHISTHIRGHIHMITFSLDFLFDLRYGMHLFGILIVDDLYSLCGNGT